MSSRKGFASPEDAARAALAAALKLSGEYEHGGVVFERDGKFYFTPPETSRKKSQLRIRAKIPKGSMRALYHTHPPGKGSDRYSPEDLEIARRFAVPYYLGMVDGGKNRVFIPKKTETVRRPTVGGVAEFSYGDPLSAPQRERLAGALKDER